MCKIIEAVDEGNMNAAFKGMVGLVKEIHKTLQENTVDIALIKKDTEYLKEDLKGLKTGHVSPPYCAHNKEEVMALIRENEKRIAKVEDSVDNTNKVLVFISKNWGAILKGLGALVVGFAVLTGVKTGIIKVDIPTVQTQTITE